MGGVWVNVDYNQFGLKSTIYIWQFWPNLQYHPKNDQIYSLQSTTFQAFYPQSTPIILAKSTIYKKGKPPPFKEELYSTQILDELKTELAKLCFAKVTGGAASKLSKICVVRKSIARVYIVMHQKHNEKLRKFYKDNKYKPINSIEQVSGIFKPESYCYTRKSSFDLS